MSPTLPAKAARARTAELAAMVIAARAARVLVVADVLMRCDGYEYAADVLADSNNPRCVRWRATAERIIAALERAR